MSRFRVSRHEVPGLNTSSLPDLIFTVLFFFIIVTHIRDSQVKVEYKTPQGSELLKLTRKSSALYLYIGRPIKSLQRAEGTDMRIQINDKFVDVDDIAEIVAKERSRMSSADAKAMTVIIKADRDTPMGVIDDVKQALRSANALKVVFSAEKERKR